MKKRTWTVILCAAAVIVLAGAAYLATRLINRGVASNDLVSADKAREAAAAGKKIGPSGPNPLPSDLIPQRDMDLDGEIAKIQDKSIFVSAVFLNGVMDPNNQNLPPVEVVVTKDTKILRSAGTETVTDSSGKTVQKKKEEEVTINDLAVDDIVDVWGEKRGDRYYADVITFIH
jgi:hypothetical protein